ncbi:MAG: flavin reductase family protein [Candidatus Dependentiae bacterium]|nr:flavin reductase family protein [Candidatus Dependentiae bacterium]
MKNNSKRALPLSKVYQYMEPGPVIMVTTSHNDKPNVMTMSWHMPVEFTPPQIAIVMGAEDYSFSLLKATGECVINIPDASLVKKVVGVGNCSGRDVDKFEKFKLTKEEASKVEPPLVKECFANFECKVIDTTLMNTYNIFIVEVVAAWVAKGRKQHHTLHHWGHGRFAIEGKMVKLYSPNTK